VGQFKGENKASKNPYTFSSREKRTTFLSGGKRKRRWGREGEEGRRRVLVAGAKGRGDDLRKEKEGVEGEDRLL